MIARNSALLFKVSGGFDKNTGGTLDIPQEVTRRVAVEVVEGDLDADSDNTNGYGEADRTAAEEAMEDAAGQVGKVIPLNNNDDDLDGEADYFDGFGGVATAGERFVPLALGVSSNVDLDKARFKLVYSDSAPGMPITGDLRLWTVDGSVARDPASVGIGGHYVPSDTVLSGQALGLEEDAQEFKTTLFAEGLRRTASGAARVQLLVDLNNTGTFLEADAVRLTVLQVDLGIDSDNNNAIDLTPDGPDDEIEDLHILAGKYIAMNDGNTDGDSTHDTVPDFADGLDTWGNGGTGASAAFTPMKLTIPDQVNLDNARVTFTYSTSDPAAIARSGSGTSEDPYVYTPAGGDLRLWTKDGSVSRKAASLASDGDFVAGGTGYTISQLAGARVGSSRVWQLYVEGIAPSAEVGQERIHVRIEPTGGGPTIKLDDAVRATVVKADLDVDSDNTMAFTTPDSNNSKQDQIEDKQWENRFPGKIAQVNDNDDDDDGIPGGSRRGRESGYSPLAL